MYVAKAFSLCTGKEGSEYSIKYCYPYPGCE